MNRLRQQQPRRYPALRVSPRRNFRSIFLGLAVLAAVLSAGGTAVCDRIILKDGTVEESDNVWESDGYVHFILKPTRDVEIRYSKDIVERIERSARGKPSDARPLDPDADTASGGNATRADAPARQEPPPVIQTPADRPGLLAAVKKIARDNKGIGFYNPRRSMRYWAHKNSRHDTLQSALSAIAGLYHRTPGWVASHMGEENDLGAIHANLARQLESGEGPAGSEPSAIDASENESAAVRQADGSAEGAGRTDQSAAQSIQPMPSVSIEPGVVFYDPRRHEKYWSSQLTRHHTLQDAIDALARLYGVTAEWIEQHMGDTNELAEIHRSIRQSLKTP